jgi:hypothetical protein
MELTPFRESVARARASRAALATFLFFTTLLLGIPAMAAPRIVIISLDGATPRIVKDLLRSGALPRNAGIGC